MSKIELHTSLDIPAGLARNEMLRIMSEIHDHKPPYADVALRIGLHDLHLPIPGQIPFRSKPPSTGSHFSTNAP